MRGIYVNRFIHQRKCQSPTTFSRKSLSVFLTEYDHILYGVLISDVVDENLLEICREIGTCFQF
jgi:hypothetical protein